MLARSKRSFLLGAGTNWLAFAATLAVGFLLTPYLIRTLGKPRYDVWCVAESVLAYFTLLDMGVAACLTRTVARRAASEDLDGLNRAASSCLAIFVAAGLVALLVGIPVLAGLAPRFHDQVHDDVLAFLLLMLANLAATLPLSTFPALLDGLERFAAKSLVRLMVLAARTGGIVLVVQNGGGLVPVALVTTLANLLEHAVMAGLCCWFLPGLRLSPRLVDRATLREVRGYSGDAFLAMLAGRITVQTGAIVVGCYLPTGAVTFFVTAARLIEYAKTLLRTITATLTPGVSAREARGDYDGIRQLFLSATRWVLYLVLPVNLGVWCLGSPFLHRWVGPEFVAGSAPALAILAGTLSVGVAQSVASRILYGLGRLRVFARLALGEAALNLGLTLLLVGPYGVEGVAAAVAVPNLVFCVLVIAYTARGLGVAFGEYARAVVKPIVAAIIPAIVWMGLGPVSPDWSAIGQTLCIGLLPYAVAVLGMEFGGSAGAEWAARRASPTQENGGIWRILGARIASSERVKMSA